MNLSFGTMYSHPVLLFFIGDTTKWYYFQHFNLKEKFVLVFTYSEDSISAILH